MGTMSLLRLIRNGLLVFLSLQNIKYCFVSGSDDENKLNDTVKVRDLTGISETERLNILCNEEILLPAKIQKQLKCRYVNRGIPFLKIAPFKEEEAFLEPRILIFHDVIYDEEIETIKSLAKPKLLVAALGKEKKFDISIRKTMTGWLSDSEHEYVKKINRRVQDMTNLNVDTAESLQTAYYETGDHYMPHYDFELNNVEKGGHTVFTKINVSLKPKKGSAAFWYNLNPNGDGDFQTEHSACPVLSGVKWVINKWLSLTGQEFNRPCSCNNKTVILN